MDEIIVVQETICIDEATLCTDDVGSYPGMVWLFMSV